jgi:hypothetical protein
VNVLDIRDSADLGDSLEERSQTSYEATIFDENRNYNLTIPPHPKMAFEGVPFAYGEPFQCPYCHTEQTVKNRNTWKYAAIFI